MNNKQRITERRCTRCDMLRSVELFTSRQAKICIVCRGEMAAARLKREADRHKRFAEVRWAEENDPVEIDRRRRAALQEAHEADPAQQQRSEEYIKQLEEEEQLELDRQEQARVAVEKYKQWAAAQPETRGRKKGWRKERTQGE